MVLIPDGMCSSFLYRILVNIVLWWETTGWYIFHSGLYYMLIAYNISCQHLLHWLGSFEIVILTEWS